MIEETHEYDGWTWRKLEDGDLVRAGDRFDSGISGWREIQPGAYTIGRGYNGRDFYPTYRKVAKVEPKRYIQITYKVTEEYARAQCRETEGRNVNITNRFKACKVAVESADGGEKRIKLNKDIIEAKREVELAEASHAALVRLLNVL